jgi:5'-nucleotidase
MCWPQEDIWAEERVSHSHYLSQYLTNAYTDGYTSLLIEEEGGTAKEIVSEENGVLISTILRQYFMSLKVLGKWKYWGKSMDKKFSSIQTNLQSTHALYNASPTSPTTSRSLPSHAKIPPKAGETSKPGLPRHPSVTKVLQQHARDESPGGSDSEQDPDTDEEDHGELEPIKFNPRELEVLRKSMNKWWRLAGLKGQPKCADEIGEGELKVDWTRAIAPRVEGRIVEVEKA